MGIARPISTRGAVSAASFVVAACLTACPARDASAAADAVQFVGAWKHKFKGGGPRAPGAASNDDAGTTHLTFDPGFSSAAGGKTTASLKSTRRVRLVDGDGGGVGVRLFYDSRLEIDEGSASIDVSLRRGKSPALLLPVSRDASPGVTALDFNWFRTAALPAGDYTLVVQVKYARRASGTYGSATPAKTPLVVDFGPAP